MLAALLGTLPLFGQFNTHSPYTRFALGHLSKNGFGQNLAMGGTGIGIHESNRINYLNPAASAALVASRSCLSAICILVFIDSTGYDYKSLSRYHAPAKEAGAGVRFCQES